MSLGGLSTRHRRCQHANGAWNATPGTGPEQQQDIHPTAHDITAAQKGIG